jgi:D-glycero-D-manno-heptose 1,7-bisphosphate phosphatase
MTAAIREPIVALDPEAAGLVGGRLPRRALFLDRDGVMNVNHGYVHTPERTDWLPGIFELARTARSAGYLLIVVTNQAGIARGYYTEAQFGQYTRWVHERFMREGAPLLATYYCPHHPEAGLGELGVECGCRKPAPGMLESAIRRWGLDPGRSVLVGDQLSDMAAAAGAGVGLAIQVRSGPALAAAAAAIAAIGR